MKSVYLIILDYNGHENTIQCLKSLKKAHQNNFDLHVLVIDNFPENPINIDTNDYADLKLEVIFNKENLGYAGGNNVGINYALKNNADYISILNNDTLVDPNFLSELVKQSEEKGDGIFVPKIYFAKGFEFHKDRYSEKDLGKVIWYGGGKIDWENVYGSHKNVDEVDNGQFNQIEFTDFATGCCFLISKKIIEKIRGFDEDYFLYYEDIDLSMKVKKLGFKIYFVPSSIVWHKNAGSSGGSGSVLQDYYITRNRLIFGMRFAPLRAKLALIRESIKILSTGRKWQRKGILDFYFHRLGKGSFK